MCTSYPYKIFSIYCKIIVVICSGLSACAPVPIYHGNRFEGALNSIVIGKTERSEVHDLLGKPIISNEVWGVDVYREGGEETTIFLPTPIFTTYSQSYYSMFVYDDNGIVTALDIGDFSLEAEGFRFYNLTERFYLLAPKIGGNLDLPKQENLEECILYVIPDGYETIRVNAVHAVRAISDGYFRLRLTPGIHLVSFFSHNNRGHGAKDFKCEPGHIIYMQFTTKIFGDPKLKLTDTPPGDLFGRQLIIYPTLPEIIMPSFFEGNE